MDGNKAVFAIITLFLAASLWLPSLDFWDSAVYGGMGKHIYSAGSSGLWEPARPIIWPLILGLFWKLGIDFMLFGSLLALAAGAASIYLVYLITKGLLSRKAALIFAALFALNTALITYSGAILTDIPAMLFTLLAAWLFFSKKSNFFVGILLGIAALTKFTSIIFIPIFLAGLYLKKSSIRGYVNFLAGAFLVLFPYFIANFIVYGNPIYPLIAGQELISTVVGNYSCPTQPLFYFYNLLLELPILLIAFIGISRIRTVDWRWATIAFSALILLIYHSFFLNCKDIRYAFLFLPFLYILAARGFYAISRNKRRTVRYALVVLIAIQLAYSGAQAFQAFQARNADYERWDGFSDYLNGEITGEVWSSTPFAALSADKKIDELIYYPVFDSKRIEELAEKLDNAQYIFLNECDIPCTREYPDCPERRENFLQMVKGNFTAVLIEKEKDCGMTVYEWRK
ncbi:glycosyltransferase family 39 protein [Candidatus Woesearchaeota archaeon]|nr:glycosyltransferase family 39 protein [Candidatus Woesearchaeota archaeon]